MRQGGKWRSLLAALGLMVVAAQALAAPVTVFGPERFDKPKGAPVEYRRSIKIANPSGWYTVNVTSGQDGTNVVKTVSVRLNGVEIIDSAALRGIQAAGRSVQLQGDNLLEVVLKGQGGNFVTVDVVGEAPEILRVSEPLSGATVAPQVTVVGEVLQPPGTEVGVVVNGIPALVDGGRFVANHVPISATSPAIVVKALFSGGHNEELRIPVQRLPNLPPFTLSGNRDGGLAPVKVLLGVHRQSSWQPGMPVPKVACSGPGAPMLAGADRDYWLQLIEPGFFLCRTVAESSAQPGSTDTFGILIQDRGRLDALLQAKWSAVQGSLADGDIEGALDGFLERSKSRYRTTFTRLQAQMPGLAAQMAAPQLKSLDGPSATYRVAREQVYQGVPRRLLYEVRFALDNDGLWKIDQF